MKTTKAFEDLIHSLYAVFYDEAVASADLALRICCDGTYAALKFYVTTSSGVPENIVAALHRATQVYIHAVHSQEVVVRYEDAIKLVLDYDYIFHKPKPLERHLTLKIFPTEFRDKYAEHTPSEFCEAVLEDIRAFGTLAISPACEIRLG